MEDTAEETPSQEVVLCNTTVAQQEDGRLAVYVNGVRMIGVVTAQITGEGNLIIGMPPHAIRLAGQNESKRPVYETKDNVIQFPLMESYRKRWAEEEAAKDNQPPDKPGA